MRAFACCFVLGAALSSLASTAFAQTQDELLEFLLLQNEAARDRVKSASYTVSFEVVTTHEDPQGEQPIMYSGRNEIFREGAKRWNSLRYSKTDPTTDAMLDEAPSAAVANESHMGIKMGGLPLYVYMHDSIDELHPKALQWWGGQNPHDVMPYLYGAEADQDLREHVAGRQTKVEKIASRYGGNDLYRLSMYAPRYSDDPDSPAGVFLLDPEKDFLITEARYFNKAGQLWIERLFSFEEHPGQDGRPLWFPSAFHETRNGRDDSGPADPDSSTIAALVQDVELNVEIDPKQFTLEALPHVEDELRGLLITWDQNGILYEARYDEGEIVLVDMAEVVESALDGLLDESANSALPVLPPDAVAEMPGDALSKSGVDAAPAFITKRMILVVTVCGLVILVCGIIITHLTRSGN